MLYRVKNQLHLLKRLSRLGLRRDAMSTAAIVQVTEADGIRTITLNNEKKRNALSYDMLEGIEHALTTNNKSTRVIVIRSSGKVFSSGHDLKELTVEAGSEKHAKVFEKCTTVMKLVQDIEVPVIAEVRGLATAAGCQLVASCDIAIASEDAKFATPGVNIGLFCHTPAVALARSVSRKSALLMLFTGQPLNAQEALTQGLISKVVKEEHLQDEIRLVAEKIAGNSAAVNALGKRTFYKQTAVSRDQAYRSYRTISKSPIFAMLAEDKMLENLELADSGEGISAFLEKRHPKWSNPQ